MDQKVNVSELVNTAGAGNLEKLKCLLENDDYVKIIEGTDKNLAGRNALIHAIFNNRLEIISFLISKGADINARSYWGGTSLTRALEQKHIEIAKYLINQGADIEEEGLTGDSPLMSALDCGDNSVVELLVEKGVDLEKHAYCTGPPLIIAVRTGSIDTVELLIKCGADINGIGSDGSTPLIEAAKLDGVDSVYVSSVRMVLLLLNNDADAKITNNSGRSYLDYLTKSQREDVNRVLKLPIKYRYMCYPRYLK